MQELINIIEKLKINSKSKVNDKINLSKETEDQILTNLCYYFDINAEFKNIEYDNRLDIVTKHFNKDICKFFDAADLWDDIHDFMICNNVKINIDDFKEYIENNKEQLYNDIKDFVL